MGQRASGSVVIFGTLLSLGVGGSMSRDASAEGGPPRGLYEQRACQAGEDRCVSRVIREMQRRFEPLAASCDHDAVFSLVYLRTTEKYLETVDEIGYSDAASVTREDSLFADYYFRAFDAYHGGSRQGAGTVPPAWQIAFDAAESRTLSAQGNAFLGISAHIQRDLPFVLYDLYLDGNGISYEDHTLVNDFLAQVDAATEIIERFDPTYPPGSDITLVAAWRETAFVNFERLRDATPAERVAITAEIEYAAAAFAVNVVASTAYPPGESSAERDAFCEALVSCDE